MDSKGMVSLSFSGKAEISFFMFLLTPLTQLQRYGYDQLRSTVISATVFWCIGSTYLRLGRLELRKSLPAGVAGFPTSSDNIRIYIQTADFVVISYVSLLLVNWSHIWLAVFPLIAIGFILVLCYELSRQRTSEKHDGGQGIAASAGHQEAVVVTRVLLADDNTRETEEDEGREAAVWVPYWVFCIMGHYSAADNFVISQFLLFFSSMLGALTRMLMRLVLTGTAPGVAQAAELLRKATLVVLLATVHAFAAELLGENVVLFILPELVPVLLWFSLHLDRSDNSSSFVTADRIKPNPIVLGAAVISLIAFLSASMNEFVLSWCAKVIVSCGVSGLLVYYLAFTLCQWLELDSTTAPIVEEAVKLLKLWAKILVTAAALLLLFSFHAAGDLGLLEKMVACRTVKIFQ